MVSSRGMLLMDFNIQWFFYLPLTFVVVLLVVTLPASVVEQSLQPVPLDAAQMNELLFQRFSDKQYLFISKPFPYFTGIFLNDTI